MTLELAEQLSQCGAVKVYKDYSGRGMYGKTTHAVTGSHVDLYHAVECYLIQNPTGQNAEQFIDEFRSDSLGMKFIWY